MPPKPVTQASRRGKRVIASPTPSSSASASVVGGAGGGGGNSEGEEELTEEEEEEEEEEIEVRSSAKDKGKAKAVEPMSSPAAVSDEMDIDDSDEDAIGSNDPRDMIVDGEESGSGEEEMDDEDDYEEAEEEEEEEEEEETIAPAKPSPVILRAPGPATVPTPRQSRGGPPVVSPAISANSTPGIKGGLRLRLNVGKPSPLGKTIAPPAEGSRRPAREAAKKAGKKSKEVAMEAALGSDQDADGSTEEDELADEDELEEEEGQGGEDMEVDVPEIARSEGASSRAVSPTKMTARQRAKGNADLQGILIELPIDTSNGKKLVLTEAERLERREEMARRRKRQTDQRKQDEQDQTINRLLRAQTGRSRNKIEAPESGSGDITPNADGTPGTGLAGDGVSGPSAGGARGRGSRGAVSEGMIRWVSTVVPAPDGEKGGDVMCRVGIPGGMVGGENIASWSVGSNEKNVRRVREGEGENKCAVDGCSNGRKYRSTRKSEVGGCSVEHLRQVNENLGVSGV